MSTARHRHLAEQLRPRCAASIRLAVITAVCTATARELRALRVPCNAYARLLG